MTPDQMCALFSKPPTSAGGLPLRLPCPAAPSTSDDFIRGFAFRRVSALIDTHHPISLYITQYITLSIDLRSHRCLQQADLLALRTAI